MSERVIPPTDSAIQSNRLLQGVIDAAKPVARAARPNPLLLAIDQLLKDLGKISVPCIPVEPEPRDIQDLNIFILDYAKAFDALHLAVGEVLNANVSSRVDMTQFTRTFTDAVEGNASYEVNRAADIMRDEIMERSR